MRIKDPLAVKQLLADRGAIKHRDAATMLDISTRTLNKVFKGRPISYGTAHKVACFIDKEVTEIAEPIPARGQ